MKRHPRSPRIEALESRRLLAGVPAPTNVVLVIEENHSYNEIVGNSRAPYINSLAQNGALFTNSFAIEHPSQPNYLDLFSGSNQGITDDNFVSRSLSAPNLGSELIAAGKTFTGYSEDLPSAGSQVETSGAYAKKHNPWSDFTNVPNNDNQPFTAFPSNYASLPTVSIVVPNLNNDMHDGTIQQGDSWLQSNIGSYANWAMTHNGLLIVTWDEDDGSQSNQVPTIFYGQGVSTGAYSEYVDHFSVLRTIEDMYSLPYAGASASSSPITDAWITLNPTDVVAGTSGNDQITLTQDIDHQQIDWTLNGSTNKISIADPSGLTIDGNGGSDTITLNYTNGTPLPNLLTLNGTFTLNGLSGTNPFANTTLDLNRSTLYISYAGASDPIGAIRGYLQNGYNGGTWNGSPTATTGVILSSAAAANASGTTAIGYIDSADGLGFNTTPNSIKLQYTLYGDTSLSTTVGFNDFTRLTQHYGQTTAATWDTGDFNYDGTVNNADFTLLSANYGTSLGSQAVPAVAPTQSTSNIVQATATTSPSDVARPWTRDGRRRTPH